MSGKIHDAAAKGFESGAEAYERGRPDYPDEAVQKLERELGVGLGRRVLDLGAGTGKFTRLLVPSGARLVAIEPVEGMRREFSAVLPEVEILPGTAEAIPLPDQSVDAVISAQAFHWFNGPAALREIHRVLPPGGRLGLIWNARDESAEWVERLTDILNRFGEGAPRYAEGGWERAFRETTLFTPMKKAQFRHTHFSTPEQVVDRVLSISYIAAQPEAERNGVADQVRSLLASDPGTRGRAEIEFPYRTDVYWCARR